MSYVKISHSSLTPTTVNIYCDNVSINWKNNIEAKPNANGTDIAEVNTKSFENPQYKLGNIHFLLSDTTSLQYSQLLALSKIKYDGTNAPTLQVQYGSGTNLVGSDGISTSIKVIIESWDYPIDVKNTKLGYMPIVNINLRETK